MIYADGEPVALISDENPIAQLSLSRCTQFSVVIESVGNVPAGLIAATSDRVARRSLEAGQFQFSNTRWRCTRDTPDPGWHLPQFNDFTWQEVYICSCFNLCTVIKGNLLRCLSLSM